MSKKSKVRTKKISAASLSRIERSIDSTGFKRSKPGFAVLSTISTFIVGFVFGLWRQNVITAKAAIVLLEHARGSEEIFGHEITRQLVMADWVVRCVLPNALDHNIPSWASVPAVAGQKVGDGLRRMTPMVWKQQYLLAITELHRIACDLENSSRRLIGLGIEREQIHTAYNRLTGAMVTLVEVCRDYFRDIRGDEHGNYWVGARFAGIASWQPDQMLPTLPSVFALLTMVRSDDTQRSIADRCVWSVPTKPDTSQKIAQQRKAS